MTLPSINFEDRNIIKPTPLHDDDESIFLPKITLNMTEDENIETFVATPKNDDLYLYTFKGIKRFVIIYEITHTLNNEIKSCEIPFYISDARTNFLRMNLLLPLICIAENKKNSSISESKSCPILQSDNLSTGLVYKTILFKNLNLQTLHTEILDFIQRENDIIPTPISTNTQIRLNKLHKSPKGIFSVLKRLETLLPFLIAIASFRLNMQYLIPLSLLEKKKFSYPFAEKEDKLSNYNEFIENFDNNVNNYKIQHKYFMKAFRRIKLHDNPIKQFEIKGKLLEFYRQSLIRSLYNLHNNIFKGNEGINQIANLEYIERRFDSFNDIGISGINDRLNICINNNINPDAIDNYSKIIDINELLHKMIMKRKNSSNLLFRYLKDYNSDDYEKFRQFYSLKNNISLWASSCNYSVEPQRPNKKKKTETTGGKLNYKVLYSKI